MGTPSLLTITMPDTPLWVLMRFRVSSTSDITPNPPAAACAPGPGWPGAKGGDGRAGRARMGELE